MTSGSRAIAFLVLVACAPGVSAPTTAPTSTAFTRVSTTVAAATSTTATSTTITPTTTPAPTTTLPPLQGLALERLTDGLAQPTVVTHRPDDPRLFVVERTGVVSVLGEDGPAPYLDISDRVTSAGIEQGMLGLAFHPEDTDRLFVYYVDDDGRRTLAEYSGDPPDRATDRQLFSLPQPAGSVDIRHYGGNLAFGPEGYLYVSLGDGADATGQGQNPDTVYGTILRIDVDGGEPYGVPPDNPFAGGPAPEVWAYGLRNPWRFTIDADENLMYVADVGQETWEEIDVVPLDAGGANLGWPDTEGNHCFLDADCDPAAFVPPVLEYGHDEGCSVTGGHVYRGSDIPELAGHYFYADWCGGWIRSFRLDDGSVADERDWSSDLSGAGQVNAFGTDAAGELYIANYAGEIHKLTPVR